ncbi:hypothetical protein [Nocardia acidivorans]|uniref:hypothetical protein n=1 Tax=Nocardia acidivorans TaxID=404580 RepID=UPI0035A24CDE
MIEIHHPIFLYAKCERYRVWLYRSPLLKDHHPLFLPVREHIKSNRLVLTVSETFKDEGMMFGSGICEVYLPPDKRGEIFNEWELSDEADMKSNACPICDHRHDSDTPHLLTS